MSGKTDIIDKLRRLPFPEPGDEVVISGIAGRFPESDNLTQLQENLFNKIDLITDDDRRWKFDNSDVPHQIGKVNNLEKFDSQFFGIDFNEAHVMDPVARMLMEHTFEAIIDAGINPRQLRGTNTGFFLGLCNSQSEKTLMYSTRDPSGYGVTGCCRAMTANRISRWLGCTGPSYCADTACSSSLVAMDQAYRAIRTGECDAALVAGCNLCLHPSISRQLYLIGALSHGGRCKSFDADANGYCRSEAIVVIYLQKSKNAKRIYARVVHTKTNCDGYKEEGITFPSSTMQRDLLEHLYEECKIPPSSLAYLEAHGTGTEIGDPVEVNAIDKVFCPGRTTPLRIGSVKSNLGHCEAASGLCSIAKMIIAMENGNIPPNLHYNHPREGIEALKDGRIQVITERTPWEGGYVGVNSFGFGGANAHTLLSSNPKEKIDNGRPSDNMPRLVVVSGRTEEAVTTLLDNLESRPVDVEYISLFHNIHSEEIPGHLYRGYTILPPRGLPQKRIRNVQHYPGVKRPICFVFSGVGSPQWPGMGEGLLKIPVFNESIKKIESALKLHGVDIIDILTNKDPKIFDNVSNSFVGTAAVQMGLVDVLASIGIIPDNIMGHSVGELGCAYVDGCISGEQMVLAAYFQGLDLIKTETIPESKEALGNSHAELNGQNGFENGKIRWLADSVKEFEFEVQAKNILFNEKLRNNMAYHDDHTATVGPKLLAYLQSVIPDSKHRSQKWLSTSVPRDSCKHSSAHLCSPEYHTNSLPNLALCEEISDSIPNNAITIDIPNDLLQTTLSRSLEEDDTIVGLTECGHKDSVQVLLEAIGKMYEVGVHPQLANFYPDIKHPVSRGTPMISPLVRWDHTDDWYVVKYMNHAKLNSGERVMKITLEDEAFNWMAGHIIDGRNLVPTTGYLGLIWETVGMMQGKIYTEISVVFEDVRFHRATTIPKEGSVELNLMIQKGSGRFEISEGDATIVTGFVRAVTNAAQERFHTKIITDDNNEQYLTSGDIYKELRVRGYQYAGLFRGLKTASLNGKKGRVAWEKNWVAFMDNILQMEMLRIDTRGLFVPTRIQKLVIDTQLHMEQLRAMPRDNEVFQITVHEDLGIVVSGGVEIRGLKVTAIAREKTAGNPVLENCKFVAYRDRAEVELKVVTRIATLIALENQSSVNIKIIELIGESDDVSPDELTSILIQDIIGDLPLLQADVNIIAPVNKFLDAALPSSIRISEAKKLSDESGAILAVGHGLLAGNRAATLELLKTAISPRGFLMVREPLNLDTGILSALQSKGFDVVLEKRTKKELVILLRKSEKLAKIATIIQVNNNEFTWLHKLQAALKMQSDEDRSDKNKILLVSEGDFKSGLMGLVNCLRKESVGAFIQGILIQDSHAPKFSLENPLYYEQIKLDLAFNVLRSGKLWGSYQFFALDPLALKPVHHALIIEQTRGDLDTIKWTEGIMQPSPRHNNLIQIHYSSINFRDVMIGTGELAVEVVAKTRQTQESVIGCEFSGRDVNGRAVMGIIETGALSNLCVADNELLWAVPDDWTLEDAATVPVAYVTAYYALYLGGKMKKGDKVLIHSGSGGVGQAAITLALHEGCEVFTTVGTPQKREFIRNQFPQIDDDHIGNSRDTSFEQLVLRRTHGQGVDIVLNSLAEEKLQASVRCLTTGGRFLEIGKFDLAANNPLGMEPFLKGISFHGVLLDKLFDASSEKKTKLTKLFTEGLSSGAIKPLVRTVFSRDQAVAAFRYMAAGMHIGKVILRVRDEDDVRQSQLPLALPRFYCSEEYSYLILGGLGGFGLELADWLVLRGAKKLVLTSRKGISNGYQRMRINIWKSYGVVVVVVVGKDASTHEGCEAILKEAIALGSVDAIFNLAVVLKDAFVQNQTVEKFEESFRVKAWATMQLDELSRTLCPHLRQFVVFSSVTGGRGLAGQTNYGMANSIMERICEARNAENLPGLAIEWGAIGEVGLLAEMQQDDKEFVIGGTRQQPISSCLRELDGFLQQDCPVVTSMVLAEKTAGSAGATNVFEGVLNIMGLKELKGVSVQRPLAELGVDSMMAVEIKHTLEREYQVFLAPSEIRSLNFARLQEMSREHAASGKNLGNHGKDETQNSNGILAMLIRCTLGISQITKDICIPLLTRPQNERGEVFIIPGIEGTYTVLESLASKLKSPTTCLQLGTNFLKLESIADMADYLIPHVKARSQGRKDFVVAGYSFGSMVAIELARRLESEGLIGRLVLIDGSPDYVKALIAESFLGETISDDQIQSNLLLGMMIMVAPSITAKLLAELKNLNTWEEKLAAFTINVSENSSLNFTTEDQQAMCSSIYSRMKAALKYESSALTPLNSPITLLKPTIPPVRFMSQDYGLGLLTQAKVSTYYAEGDHVTMLDDAICAAAIDGELTENVETCDYERCEGR